MSRYSHTIHISCKRNEHNLTEGFWRILVWRYCNILSPKNNARKIDKIHKNFWTITSLQLRFSVLKCLDIRKLYIAIFSDFWGQGFLNYIKSSCIIVPECPNTCILLTCTISILNTFRYWFYFFSVVLIFWQAKISPSFRKPGYWH